MFLSTLPIFVIGEFNPLTFKVTIDKERLISVIVLLVFSRLYSFPLSFLALQSFVLVDLL